MRSALGIAVFGGSLIFSIAVSASARQATADASFQDPRIHESLVTTPAGGLVLHIQNNTSHAVTAYEVRIRHADQNGEPGFDDERHLDWIPSGGDPDREFRGQHAPGPNAAADYVIVPDAVAGKYPLPAKVGLLAVVFDDGSSAGDPAWVSVIVGRRKAFLEAIQNVLPMLLAVQAGTQSADNVISQLQQMSKQPNADLQAKWKVAWQADRRASPTPHVTSGAWLVPLETAQDNVQRGFYEGTADNLRHGENEGRLTNVLNILIREDSRAVQSLQGSKPALN